MTRFAQVPATQLVLVAGGSGAIGAAVVDDLLDRGYGVLATYRDTSPKLLCPAATWVRFDLTIPDVLADHDPGTYRGRGEARDHLKPTVALRAALDADARPLTAVLHAVGKASSKAPVAATSPREFMDLFTVNALSLATIWQAVAQRLRSAEGSVVAISSEATRQFGVGNGAYTAGKAGLEAIVRTIAHEEAGHGIRANVLAPSLVDSPMAHAILDRKGVVDHVAAYAQLPWGRPLTCREVARVATSVALDPSWRYLNGAVLPLSADPGST